MESRCGSTIQVKNKRHPSQAYYSLEHDGYHGKSWLNLARVSVRLQDHIRYAKSRIQRFVISIA